MNQKVGETIRLEAPSRTKETSRFNFSYLCPLSTSRWYHPYNPTRQNQKITSKTKMDYSPMMLLMLLALTPSEASVTSEGGVTARVEELPQPLMSVQSFTFNHGKPFLAETDPLTGALDLRTTPVAKGAAQEDYLYEEFEDSGDSIDRKDGASNQNVISPFNSKESDLHKFLNLPVHYSSSGKYPLVSSSYANTKIQGHASNHRLTTSTTAQTPSTVPPSYYTHKSTGTTTLGTTSTSTTTTTTTTTTPKTTSTSSLYEYEYDYDYSEKPKGDYEFLGFSSEVHNASDSTPRPFTEKPTTTTESEDYKEPYENNDSIFDNILNFVRRPETPNRGTVKYQSSTTTEVPRTSEKITTTKKVPVTTTTTVKPPSTTVYYATEEIIVSSSKPFTKSTEVPFTVTKETETQVKHNATNGHQDKPDFRPDVVYEEKQTTQKPLETTTKSEEKKIQKPDELKPKPTGLNNLLKPPMEPSKVEKVPPRPQKPEDQLPQLTQMRPPQRPPIRPNQEPSRPINLQQTVSFGPSYPAQETEYRPARPPNEYNRPQRPDVQKPQENVFTQQRPPNKEPEYRPVLPQRPQQTQEMDYNRPILAQKPQQNQEMDYNRPFLTQRPQGVEQNRPVLPQRPQQNQDIELNRPVLPQRPQQNQEMELNRPVLPQRPQQTQEMELNRPLLPQRPQQTQEMEQNRPVLPQRPQQTQEMEQNRPVLPQRPQNQEMDYNRPVLPPRPVENPQRPFLVNPQYPRPGFNFQKRPPYPQWQSEFTSRPQENGDVLWQRPQTVKPTKPPYNFFMTKPSEKEKKKPETGAQVVGSVETVSIGSQPTQPSKTQSHFIQVSSGQDNPSYSLQTSFAIGGPTDGHVQFPQEEPAKKYSPRPQWEQKPLKPQNLPNILPQFRPNAKVGHADPHVHHAYVREPLDTLQPPPLPKPEFLRSEEPVNRRNGQGQVTTLQMMPNPPRILRSEEKEEPVFVVYPSNGGEGVVVGTRGPQRPLPPDNLMNDQLDAFPLETEAFKARVDTPILKGKPKPLVKNEFPYPIVKPALEEKENETKSTVKEYTAFSPTVSTVEKEKSDEINIIPYLQDYMPFATKKPQDPVWAVGSDTKPISVTLNTKTTVVPPATNHKSQEAPTPLDFQAPFQASASAPNKGWSVVSKGAENEISTKETTTSSSTTTQDDVPFDAQNFKPQLFGGFKPILPPSEPTKKDD